MTTSTEPFDSRLAPIFTEVKSDSNRKPIGIKRPRMSAWSASTAWCTSIATRTYRQ